MIKNGFLGGNIEPTRIENDSNGNLIYNTAITFKAFLRADQSVLFLFKKIQERR